MASPALNVIPGLIGLGTQIATAIPGLRKPKKVDTARQVAKLAPSVAGSAVGAAQAGHGASRGLALREGLRQAAGAAGEVAKQARLAAAQDAVVNQQNLEARNQRLASFGKDIAAGAGTFAQSMIKPPGEAPPTPEQRQEQKMETIQAQPEIEGAVKSVTGLDGAGAALLEQPTVEELPEELAPEATVESLLQAQADEAAGPAARFSSTQALEGLLVESPTVAAPQIEADLENRLQAKNLMLQDAERLGIQLGPIYAQINRRLGLSPGQSVNNPLGVSLDLEGEE